MFSLSKVVARPIAEKRAERGINKETLEEA